MAAESPAYPPRCSIYNLPLSSQLRVCLTYTFYKHLLYIYIYIHTQLFNMSKVTEDLGYKVDEVQSTRIEAEKIDDTFKSGFIGNFTPPFPHFRLHQT